MLPYARMQARPLAEAVGVIVGALGLTVLLTYPLAFRIDRVGRVNTGDGQHSIWNVAWVARALVTDPRALYDANIFHPHRNTLAFSESNLGAGVLALPAYWATRNPFFAHNVAVLIAFTLTGVGTYYLARYLTGRRGPAAIAAVAFAFCPFVFAHTAHVQLLMTAGLPFSLLAFHRFIDRRTFGRAVTLGLVLVAQALSCAYYGIFAGLTVGLGTLFYAARRSLWRDRSFWLRVGTAAATALIVAWPFFRPYLEIEREVGFGRTLQEAALYAANWRAYLASAAWAHRWMASYLGQWTDVLFPGLVPATLGLLGIYLGLRPRATRTSAGAILSPQSSILVTSGAVREATIFYTLVALLAFWMSLGPRGGLYTLFYYMFPPFAFMRAPARFGVLVSLALAVLTAAAVTHLTAKLRPRTAAVVATLVAGVTALELATIPLPLPVVDPPPTAHRLLATLPPGAVAEFPFFWRREDFHRHAYYMLLSTYHWKPLVNGYSDYIPPDFRRIVSPVSSFPTRESFRILKGRGARYVVFHLDMYDRRSREKLMDRLAAYQAHLRPLVRDGDVWLYEIAGWPDDIAR